MEKYESYACRIEISATEGGCTLNLMGGEKGEAIRPHELHREENSGIRSNFIEEYSGWEDTYEDGELQAFIN